MARKTKAQAKAQNEETRGKYAPAKSGEVEWGGFVNVRLSEGEKESFTVWLQEEGAYFWNLLTDTVAQGLKFGASWDADNDCFITTFTGCGVLGDESRFCLTARAGSFEEAAALLVYKHVVVAAGDWAGHYRPVSHRESWG